MSLPPAACDRIPVVWLCGPPGVGKSTVGWAVYSQLADAGYPAGYVDIDQLGVCYPEPDDDPGRHRIKGRNLAAVVATFRTAGVACVVVSGVVDLERVVDYEREASAARLVWCRLRLHPRELLVRLDRRGVPDASIREVLAEANAMEGTTFADLTVETDGLTAADVTTSVLRFVRGLVDEAPGPRSREVHLSAGVDTGPTPTRPDGPILWLSGPSAVGKSAVGWTVFQQVLASGHTAAFVDLEQIGFVRPARAEDPSGHRLRARNLARVWSTFRSAGADCLVVVGTLGGPTDLRPYSDELPEVAWSLCRLRAGRRSLAERIDRRRAGGGPDLADDRLRHLRNDEAAIAVDAALGESVQLDAAGLPWPVVDTDGATVDEVARRVQAVAVRWPG